MKKNKEKEKNTNPYHKEYGVFSNSIHALKSMLNYSHRFCYNNQHNLCADNAVSVVVHIKVRY